MTVGLSPRDLNGNGYEERGSEIETALNQQLEILYIAINNFVLVDY